jgi:hypothetical protein
LNSFCKSSAFTASFLRFAFSTRRPWFYSWIETISIDISFWIWIMNFSFRCWVVHFLKEVEECLKHFERFRGIVQMLMLLAHRVKVLQNKNFSFKFKWKTINLDNIYFYEK